MPNKLFLFSKESLVKESLEHAAFALELLWYVQVHNVGYCLMQH